MSGVMDFLLSLEFKENLYLQENLASLEAFFQCLSTYMSPVMILTTWIPLIGAFDLELLIDLMILVPSTTFLSNILKWIIPEHRPFWWVEETTLFNPKTIPSIKILPETCQTSSGAFSTHSMVFTVFVVIVGMKFIACFRRQNPCERNEIKYGAYLCAILASSIMWISRMYLMTSFLHQCILGSILGALIVYYYYENWVFQATIFCNTQKNTCRIVLLISAGVLILYVTILGIGFDLQWPVRVAFKWCKNADYLSPETTPIYLVVSCLGTLFGVAAAAPFFEKREMMLNIYRSLTIALLIIAVNGALHALTPTTYGRLAFLSFVFARFFIFSYTVTHIAPKKSEETEEWFTSNQAATCCN